MNSKVRSSRVDGMCFSFLTQFHPPSHDTFSDFGRFVGLSVYRFDYQSVNQLINQSTSSTRALPSCLSIVNTRIGLDTRYCNYKMHTHTRLAFTRTIHLLTRSAAVCYTGDPLLASLSTAASSGAVTLSRTNTTRDRVRHTRIATPAAIIRHLTTGTHAPELANHRPEIKVWSSLTQDLEVVIPRKPDFRITPKSEFLSGTDSSHLNAHTSSVHSEQPRDICASGSAKPLTWYICGPTVYDASHIGHARTYVCFDIIARILTDYFNQPVFLAMGVTDIDDKIINRAKELQVDWRELARYYENAFRHDLARLNVRPPAVSLRVSEHIPDILSFIGTVMDKGFAYETPLGVYFDVAAFERAGNVYGKFRGGTPASNEQVDISVLEDANTILGRSVKRSPRDFALWKRTSPDNTHEPSWPSPWGPGRPGWHIECSAMTASLFGNKLDMHSGGVDLIFPHHSNEVAQCEAFACQVSHGNNTGNHKQDASASSWCNLWLHTGHLHIDGLKMSKSLKNFITIDQMLTEHGCTADQFRYFCLQSHYRSTIDYSLPKLKDAARQLARVQDFEATLLRELRRLGHMERQLSKLLEVRLGKATPSHESPLTSGEDFSLLQKLRQKWGADELQLHASLREAQEKVAHSLRRDFDTPQSLSALLQLMGDVNKYLHTTETRPLVPCQFLLLECARYIFGMFHIFGFEFASRSIFVAPISAMWSADFDLADKPKTSSTDPHAIATALAQFRSRVREAALAVKPRKATLKAAATVAAEPNDGKVDAKEYLNVLTQLNCLCDELLKAADDVRDKTLPQLGFVLKDLSKASGASQPGGSFELRPVRPEERASSTGLH